MLPGKITRSRGTPPVFLGRAPRSSLGMSPPSKRVPPVWGTEKRSIKWKKGGFPPRKKGRPRLGQEKTRRNNGRGVFCPAPGAPPSPPAPPPATSSEKPFSALKSGRVG